jgi:DNA-binding LacI/PurR family transcriptional regulator
MGARAARLLIRQLEGDERGAAAAGKPARPLPVRLVERGTTAARPSSDTPSDTPEAA